MTDHSVSQDATPHNAKPNRDSADAIMRYLHAIENHITRMRAVAGSMEVAIERMEDPAAKDLLILGQDGLDRTAEALEQFGDELRYTEFPNLADKSSRPAPDGVTGDVTEGGTGLG